jgi:hypothetical protein
VQANVGGILPYIQRDWVTAFDLGKTNMRIYVNSMLSSYRMSSRQKNAYRILVGTPEGNRPLGRPRRRWLDNIKMDIREVGWDGMD